MPDPIFAARKEALQKSKDLRIKFFRLFSSEDGKEVLSDLSKFCFVEKTTLSVVPGQTEANEGARRVWLYITRMMVVDNPTQAQNTDNLKGGSK